MKPLNLDNRPCSPISSNCVIWQGPDIPCINLCTGDTVSDVVFKLATELCAIMDTLKITNYDLSCFNLAACPPQDFQELIQFLINKICELEGVTPGTDGGKSTCPDCVVTVAPCFITGNQTTMQLVDYVIMIGQKVCDIIDQITDINNQIESLDIRVTVLENTPPPTFTLPPISTGCLSYYMSGATAASIDAVLNTLLNNATIGYCALIGATSLPANLLAAVASQCIANGDDSLANPGDSMATAYGPYTGFGTWQSTPVTVADAINNLWISVCDIYSYLSSLNVPEVDVVAGNGINVTSSTVGDLTTYTVSTLGAMRAQGTPSSLLNVTPTANTNLYDANAVTQIMTEIYDDDNAYDPLTGLWTCPTTGIYNLSFYVHLSKVSGVTNIPFTSGMVIAGIIANIATGYYCVDTMAVNQITRHIDITGNALGINLTVGTQLKLNILNMTDVDYDPYTGDVARMVIQRVR